MSSGRSAIDREGRTRHETCLVGSKIKDRLGDLIRHGNGLQRRMVDHPLLCGATIGFLVDVVAADLQRGLRSNREVAWRSRTRTSLARRPRSDHCMATHRSCLVLPQHAGPDCSGFGFFLYGGYLCLWMSWYAIANQLDDALIVSSRLSVHEHVQNDHSFVFWIAIFGKCPLREIFQFLK